MENSKNLWLGLGAIVVIVLLIWMIKASRNDVPTESGEGAEIESTEDTSEGSVNKSAVPVVTLSYTNAIKQYEGKRIQLDKTCQAIPNNVTYKNGTSIMIDNRAPVARTVKLGSTFSVKAYGFKIVKLSSATLPATWLMDCDSSQNVATVLIQK